MAAKLEELLRMPEVMESTSFSNNAGCIIRDEELGFFSATIFCGPYHFVASKRRASRFIPTLSLDCKKRAVCLCFRHWTRSDAGT